MEIAIKANKIIDGISDDIINDKVIRIKDGVIMDIVNIDKFVPSENEIIFFHSDSNS